MPTVLFLNLYATLGGAENALLGLLGAFDRSVWRPLVVVSREGPLVEALRHRGVEAHVFPFPAPPLHRLASPRVLAAVAAAARRLGRLVGDRDVSIVQVGDTLGLLLALPARCRGARVVWQVNYLGGWPRVALTNLLALAAADRILVFSQAQRAELLARTVGLASRTAVVPPGIAPVRDSPSGRGVRETLGIPPGAAAVGMAARFDAWKGHRVFLEAAARLLARRGDLHFLVAGGALNEDQLPHVARCREEFLAERRRLGLEGRVHVLGFVPDLPEVMAAMDVLVCPSEDEPFGLVVVEALAAGTPVVVADSGGPPEIVDHGRCGLVFPTGDAGGLADQVLRLLGDQGLARGLADAGKRRVEERFTDVGYARAMEGLYATLG